MNLVWMLLLADSDQTCWWLHSLSPAWYLRNHSCNQYGYIQGSVQLEHVQWMLEFHQYRRQNHIFAIHSERLKCVLRYGWHLDLHLDLHNYPSMLWSLHQHQQHFSSYRWHRHMNSLILDQRIPTVPQDHQWKNLCSWHNQEDSFYEFHRSTVPNHIRQNRHRSFHMHQNQLFVYMYYRPFQENVRNHSVNLLENNRTLQQSCPW